MDELTGAKDIEARVEEINELSGAPILKIIGEVDLASVGAIREVIELVIAREPDTIVFDLSELQFMDSSGLAMLLVAAERINVVELRNLSPMMRKVIQLTGLTEMFQITP